MLLEAVSSPTKSVLLAVAVPTVANVPPPPVVRPSSYQLLPPHFSVSVLVDAVVKLLASLRFHPFVTVRTPSKIRVISVPGVMPVPETLLIALELGPQSFYAPYTIGV